MSDVADFVLADLLEVEIVGMDWFECEEEGLAVVGELFEGGGETLVYAQEE